MAVDLGSVRSRVKATGLFRTVEDAQSLSAAFDKPAAFLPAAFVVVPRERADANVLIGRHRQRISARVSVAFCVQAQRAAGEPSDEVEAIREVLKNHLANWQPAGAGKAFEYAFSNMIGLRDGLVWAEVAFDTEYHFTASP